MADSRMRRRSYREALQLFPAGQAARVALSEPAYASGQ